MRFKKVIGILDKQEKVLDNEIIIASAASWKSRVV